MISLNNVSYSYPFQTEKAISDITLEVSRGEVVLLTGESGCGKSTVIKTINGLIPHYFKGSLEGKIYIDGENASNKTIGEISRSIGTLFQDPEQQFFCNDVFSELAFANEVKGISPEIVRGKVNDFADKFEINSILNSSIFTLSEGEKQKVALASILLLEPNSLVLDEPTANLSPNATEDLGKELLKLKSEGYSILIADHRLYWLAGIVDKVLVMKNGQIVEEGDYSILESDKLRAEFGLRASSLSGLKEMEENFIEGLEIKNLTFAYKRKPSIFKNFSISFQSGQITALRGANGVGKTTLSKLITGLLKAEAGEFYLNSTKLTPKELLKKTSLVLQNADHQLYSRTLLEEVDGNMELLKKVRLNIFSERHPQSLSSGQKQRLVIASAISRNPEIIILDEPTSGLDGENMRIIGEMLRAEAQKNKVVIVITHDLEFIDKCCDKQVVMKGELQ